MRKIIKKRKLRENSKETDNVFKNSASAGSRTRIYCLEGNNADRYTTDALMKNDYGK